MQISTVNTLLKKGLKMITTIGEVEKYFVFARIDGQYNVIVEGFNDGFAEILVPVSTFREGTKITITIMNKDDFISFIAGCFSKNSNFKEKLFRAFGCTKETDFKGIRVSIQEFHQFITVENSFVIKVEEIIKKLLLDFTVQVLKEEQEEDAIHKERTKEIVKLLESLDIAFRSDKAEDEYEEAPTEISDEDLGYGEDFIKYVQYLHREKDQDIFDAVKETYTTFVGYWSIPQNDGQIMKFICKYCRYGDEIYEAYTEILTQAFADELENM